MKRSRFKATTCSARAISINCVLGVCNASNYVGKHIAIKAALHQFKTCLGIATFSVKRSHPIASVKGLDTAYLLRSFLKILKG